VLSARHFAWLIFLLKHALESRLSGVAGFAFIHVVL
jgi:hypothetical protein